MNDVVASCFLSCCCGSSDGADVSANVDGADGADADSADADGADVDAKSRRQCEW